MWLITIPIDSITILIYTLHFTTLSGHIEVPAGTLPLVTIITGIHGTHHFMVTIIPDIITDIRSIHHTMDITDTQGLISDMLICQEHDPPEPYEITDRVQHTSLQGVRL